MWTTSNGSSKKTNLAFFKISGFISSPPSDGLLVFPNEYGFGGGERGYTVLGTVATRQIGRASLLSNTVAVWTVRVWATRVWLELSGVANVMSFVSNKLGIDMSALFQEAQFQANKVEDSILYVDNI